MTIDRTGHAAALFFINLWAAIRSFRRCTALKEDGNYYEILPPIASLLMAVRDNAS